MAVSLVCFHGGNFSHLELLLLSLYMQQRLVDGADYDEDDESGFLKLKPTQEWIVGETDSAPMNRKALAKVCHLFFLFSECF